MFFGKDKNRKKENQVENEYFDNTLPSLDQKIEAILFYKASEVSLAFLAKTLGEKKKKILEALEVLRQRLRGSALVVLESNDKYVLATSQKVSKTISLMRGEESVGELSTPALETLSIILYKGPIKKSDLDQIRGVNSAYILRNLLIRGLIEKERKEDGDYYLGTTDLLRFLGIDSVRALPGYEKVREILDKVEKEDDEEKRGDNLSVNEKQ